MFRSDKKGVTLLEIAIVIAIIGFMTVTALSYYNSTRQTALKLKALEDMNQLKTAVKLFMSEDVNENNRKPTSEAELIRVQFEYHNDSGDVLLSEPIHYMDSITKSPWGLSYNIDHYNIVAWSTSERAEKHKGWWGKRLEVPYNDIYSENFEADDISTDIWTVRDSGTSSYYEMNTSSISFSSPHDPSANDFIFLELNEIIRIKGNTMIPVDEQSMITPIFTITTEFNYWQDTDSSSVKLVSGHAIDMTVEEEDFDKYGAILLWPVSGPPPQPLDDINTITALAPGGVFFSNKGWDIVRFNTDTATHNSRNPGEEGHNTQKRGAWAPGDHEIKLNIVYDSIKAIFRMDTIIDGDLKTSVDMSSCPDDEFYFTISPDQFQAGKNTLNSLMTIKSIKIDGVNFSKYYKDLLWDNTNTFGH